MFKLFGKKSSKKASLGEESSFYYNEKLGRWVERGKEDEAAKEAELPPPPKSISSSFSRQSLLSDPGPASHGSVAGKSVCEDSDSAPPTGPPLFHTKRALGDRYVPVFSSSNSSRSQTSTQMFLPVATAAKSKPATFYIPSPVVSSNNLADQADSANQTISSSVSEQAQVDHLTEAVSQTSVQALLDEPEEPPEQHAKSIVANADESPAVNETLDSPAAYSDRYQSGLRAPEGTSIQPEADAVTKLDESVSADVEGPTAETITQEADVAAYSYENWYASQQSDANVTAINEGNAAAYWSQWGAYDAWTQEQKDYYAAYCQYWSSAQPQAMEESTALESEVSAPAQVHNAVANQVMETEIVDTSAVAAATEDVAILQSTFEEEEIVESSTHVFTEIPLTGESQGLTSENGVCVDDDSASSHDGSGVSDQSGYAVKNESNLFGPLNWIKQKSNPSQGKLVGMPWDNVAAVDYDQYWKGTDDDFYQQPAMEPESQLKLNTNHRFLGADLGTAAQPEASSKPGVFGLLSPPLFGSLEAPGNSLPNNLTPITNMHDSTSLVQLPVAAGAWDQSVVGKVMPAMVNQPVSELLISKDALVVTDGAGMAEATSTASHPLPDEDLGDIAASDSAQPAADAASKPVEAGSTTTQPTCDPFVATEADPICQDMADPMVDRMATINEGLVVSTETAPDGGVAMALGLTTKEPAERPTWPGPNGWDYVEGADYSKYYYTPDFSAWGDYSTWDTEKMQIYWEWYYGCQYYQHQVAVQAASEQGLSVETSSEMVGHDTAAAVETIQAADGQDTATAVETIQPAYVDPEGPQDEIGNQDSVHVSRTVPEQDNTPADGHKVAALPERENGATMEHGYCMQEHENAAAFQQQTEAPDYTSALTSYELAYAGYGPPQAAGDASTSRAGPPSHGGRMPLPERHTFDDMAAEEMDDIYLPDATQPEPTQKSDPTIGWDTHLNDSWDNEVNTDGWDVDPAAAASGHIATSPDSDIPASILSPLRRHSSCSVQVTNTPQPPHTPPRDDHATSPAYIDEDIVPASPTRIVEDAPAPTSSIPTPSTSSTSGVPLSSATQNGPSPFPTSETTTASQPSTSSAAHVAVMHSTASTSTPVVSALPPLAPTHHVAESLHPSIDTQPQMPTTNAANTAPAIAQDDAEDFFSRLGGAEDPEPAFCSTQTESSHSSTAAIHAYPFAAHAQQQSDPSGSFFEPAAQVHTVGTAPPYAVSSAIAPPVISPASGLAAATEEELDFFEHLGEEQEADTGTALTDPFSATAVFAPGEELATAFGCSLVESAQVVNNTRMEDDRPEPSSQPAPLAQPPHQNLLDAAFNDPSAFFSGLLGTDSERDIVDASVLAGPHLADNSAVSGTLSSNLAPSAVSVDFSHSTNQDLAGLTPPAHIGSSLPHEQTVDTSHAVEPNHLISSALGVNNHPDASILSECASPSSIMTAAAHPPHIDVHASNHHNHATSGGSTPAGEPSPVGHASIEQTTPAGTSTAGPSSPNGHYASSIGDAYASSGSDAIASRTAASTTVAADDGASSSSDPGATSTVTPQPYLFDWSQNPRPDWSLWGPRETWGPDAQAMYSDWARWRKEKRPRRQTASKKGPRSQAHSSTHTSSATTPEHSAVGADTVGTITTAASAAAEMQEPASSSRDSAGTSSICIAEDVSNAGPSTALDSSHSAAQDGAHAAQSASSEPVHEPGASAFPQPVVSDPTWQVGSTTVDQVGAVVQEPAAAFDDETTEVFTAEAHDAIPIVAVSSKQDAHEIFAEETVSGEHFDASAQYDISEQDLQQQLEVDEVWGAEEDVGEQPAASDAIEHASASENIVNQPASHVASEPNDVAASQPASEDGSAVVAAVSSPKVEQRTSKDAVLYEHLAAVADMATGDNAANVTAEVADAGLAAGAELEVAKRVSLYNKNLERFVQEREALTDECLNLMDLGVEDVELPDEKDNVAMQELMFDLGKAKAQVELLLQFCKDNGLDGKAFLCQNDL